VRQSAPSPRSQLPSSSCSRSNHQECGRLTCQAARPNASSCSS
jgi:hypothetical protein